MQDDAVHAVRQLDALAVRADQLAEFEVGVVDHRKDILKLRIHFAAQREDLFFGGGEDVLFVADELPQIVVVVGEAGVGRKGAKRRLVQRGQFGLDEGSFRREADVQRHGARLHRRVLGDARVLVVAHVRVQVQPLDGAGDLLLLFEECGEGGRVLQLSRPFMQGDGRLRLLVTFFPCLVGGKDVLYPPTIFCLYFASFHTVS